MKRDQMIEVLVVDSLVRILDRNRIIWLSGILERGFLGYANMTDRELQHELIARGLSLRDGDMSADDAQGGNDDDEDALLQQARFERNDRNALAFEVN